MTDLNKRLSDIQRTMKAPKEQFNKFGAYFYRSCEDILEAVKPLLGDAIITLNDKVLLIGERFYVKATATIKMGQESIAVSAFAREAECRKGMDDSQITGSASSYARKYALNGLLLIDDNKDVDQTRESVTESGKPYKEEAEPNERSAMKNAKESLQKCVTLAELREAWELLPPNLQHLCKATKDNQKARIESENLTGA